MPDTSALKAEERYVFVYGTLRQGGANDITKLEPAPRWIGHASVRGDLFHLGGYPGLVLNDEGSWVTGEVYGIEPALERRLDAIEGLLGPQPSDEYAKRFVSVQCEGKQLLCLVYEINRRYVAKAARIVHGDWMKA